MQLDVLRRYKGFETSVNFLAHSLVISSLASVYGAIIVWRSVFLTLLLSSAGLVTFTAILLTGSRSSVVSFFVGLTLLLLFGQIIRVKVIFLSLMLIIGIMLLIIYISSVESFQGLIVRFTFDAAALETLFGIRFDLWLRSIEYVTIESFLFGKAWLYEIYGQGLVHPHNIFISMLVYTGFLTVLVFFAVLTRITWMILSAKRIPIITKIFMIVLILIFLFYASVSGNFTRILTIFAILGLVDGWLRVYIKNEKPLIIKLSDRS